MAKPPPTDLSTATMEELCAEIIKRSDGVVIVMDRPGKNANDVEQFIRYHGSYAHIYGLALYAARRIEQWSGMSNTDEFPGKHENW